MSDHLEETNVTADLGDRPAIHTDMKGSTLQLQDRGDLIERLATHERRLDFLLVIDCVKVIVGTCIVGALLIIGGKL